MDETSQKPRVLMVEDNMDDIILSRRLFERCGAAADVDVVRDGEIALEYLFGKGAYAGQEGWSRIRLILLDMNLPRISGLQFLQKIRKDPRTEKLPVVILTISGMNEDVIQKSRLPISGYLRKPIEMHDFLNCYQEHVSRLVEGR